MVMQNEKGKMSPRQGEKGKKSVNDAGPQHGHDNYKKSARHRLKTT